MTPFAIWLSGFLAGLGASGGAIILLSLVIWRRQQRTLERDRQRAIKSAEEIGASVGKALADAGRERAEAIVRATKSMRN